MGANPSKERLRDSGDQPRAPCSAAARTGEGGEYQERVGIQSQAYFKLYLESP